MSFQVMAEPGLFTMLLDRLRRAEHGGASSLMFLVIFSCQAVAAWLAGGLLARIGYHGLLTAAGALALMAALLCRFLLRAASPVRETVPKIAGAD
jgi:predicted MFS family arabinose efflux permease